MRYPNSNYGKFSTPQHPTRLPLLESGRICRKDEDIRKQMPPQSAFQRSFISEIQKFSVPQHRTKSTIFFTSARDKRKMMQLVLRQKVKWHHRIEVSSHSANVLHRYGDSKLISQEVNFYFNFLLLLFSLITRHHRTEFSNKIGGSFRFFIRNFQVQCFSKNTYIVNYNYYYGYIL